MDNDNHKKTWENFTKFVLWGTISVIAILIVLAIVLL
ncbi:aa3-type cytochrome c oxidase subunit IV [Candidatus Pelagibacter communis]|nr:aa3-type cytochrome c oxidase subunit IV [Candidatus Pelagibacter ubique]